MSAVAVSSAESPPASDLSGALPSTGSIDLATDLTTGLTAREVAERRATGFGDQVDEAQGRTYQQIIRDNLFTFLNVSLFGIGAVLVALGLYRDAIMSSGFALANASIAINQELIAKRRPTILAIAMIPPFAVIITVEWLRRFFDVTLLDAGAYAIIAAVAVTWLVLLRYVYATYVFERFFGLEIEPH
jgi:hypothetical protein